jgi:hypothetical protein
VLLREDPGHPLSALVFGPPAHLLVPNPTPSSLPRLEEPAEACPEHGRDVDVAAGQGE